MKKIIVACFILMLLITTTPSFAQTKGEDPGEYIINRGIFGCVYKVVTSAVKVVEYVIFGRYGICGLNDYFRIDKECAEKTPKY